MQKIYVLRISWNCSSIDFEFFLMKFSSMKKKTKPLDLLAMIMRLMRPTHSMTSTRNART